MRALQGASPQKKTKSESLVTCVSGHLTANYWEVVHILPCMQVTSVVSDSLQTHGLIAHQAPLSMGIL